MWFAAPSPVQKKYLKNEIKWLMAMKLKANLAVFLVSTFYYHSSLL